MSDMAFSTMTLHDALIIDNTLLNFISLETTEQTNKMKEIFLARWDIYEIGGETLPLFKRYLTNNFNKYKDYYQELIDDYENKINYLDGITSTEGVAYTDTADGASSRTVNGDNELNIIDLPNKQVSTNYVSQKNLSTDNLLDSRNYSDGKSGSKTITRSGDVNILEQKIKYQKYLRNIYLEFAERFKDCFVLIYN